ncbi:MAG: hypothetical protein Ct9H300mP31_03730 [Acidimicrobiaceae bacterium]|nr:MAG: hypothetical protein Ct9H300mP31_03730 [Acidimicrobiaceae bacterium]
MVIDPAKTYSAEMVTSMGTMTIHLDPIAAPQTVNNFVYLARWHYYDGLVFHRVIKGFVIQGGCPEGSGRGGPGYRFADELPKPGRYEVGSLVMANAGPEPTAASSSSLTGPRVSAYRPPMRCSARSSRASRWPRPSRRSGRAPAIARWRTWLSSRSP